MAAASDRLAARLLYPTSSGRNQSVRKWVPSTMESVVARTGPRPQGITAASSPIPTVPSGGGPTRRRRRSRSPSSPMSAKVVTGAMMEGYPTRGRTPRGWPVGGPQSQAGTAGVGGSEWRGRAGGPETAPSSRQITLYWNTVHPSGVRCPLDAAAPPPQPGGPHAPSLVHAFDPGPPRSLSRSPGRRGRDPARPSRPGLGPGRGHRGRGRLVRLRQRRLPGSLLSHPGRADLPVSLPSGHPYLHRRERVRHPRRAPEERPRGGGGLRGREQRRLRRPLPDLRRAEPPPDQQRGRHLLAGEPAGRHPPHLRGGRSHLQRRLPGLRHGRPAGYLRGQLRRVRQPALPQHRDRRGGHPPLHGRGPGPAHGPGPERAERLVPGDRGRRLRQRRGPGHLPLQRLRRVRRLPEPQSRSQHPLPERGKRHLHRRHLRGGRRGGRRALGDGRRLRGLQRGRLAGPVRGQLLGRLPSAEQQGRDLHQRHRRGGDAGVQAGHPRDRPVYHLQRLGHRLHRLRQRRGPGHPRGQRLHHQQRAAASRRAQRAVGEPRRRPRWLHRVRTGGRGGGDRGHRRRPGRRLRRLQPRRVRGHHGREQQLRRRSRGRFHLRPQAAPVREPEERDVPGDGPLLRYPDRTGGRGRPRRPGGTSPATTGSRSGRWAPPPTGAASGPASR